MFLYSVAIITHTRHLVNKVHLSSLGTCYYFSLALLKRKIGEEKKKFLFVCIIRYYFAIFPYLLRPVDKLAGYFNKSEYFKQKKS